MVVGSERFLENFTYYDRLLRTRKFAPNFTVMTADKDDPRFDEFYLKGNEARQFMAYFLTDMPSYNGLGFEVRDAHPVPAPNEFYTKLYVFQLQSGKNATLGPYKWGLNGVLFHHLTRLKIFADEILPQINNAQVNWLRAPSSSQYVLAWTQAQDAKYVFVVNLDIDNTRAMPTINEIESDNLVFSTITEILDYQTLNPGEARAYRIANN
jgi:hypothetical protein